MDKLAKKALSMMESVAKIQADQEPASVARLKAMAEVVKDIPWDNVHSIEIGWESVLNVDMLELCPKLNIVMKGDLP